MSNNEYETDAKLLAEKLGIKDFYVLGQSGKITDLLPEKREQPICCVKGERFYYIVFRNSDSTQEYLILYLNLRKRIAELRLDSNGANVNTINEIIQYYSGKCIADIAEKARKAKELNFDFDSEFPDEVLEYTMPEEQKKQGSNSITKTPVAHG